LRENDQTFRSVASPQNVSRASIGLRAVQTMKPVLQAWSASPW
jgi:hypothetical protein